MKFRTVKRKPRKVRTFGAIHFGKYSTTLFQNGCITRVLSGDVSRLLYCRRTLLEMKEIERKH